PEDRPAPVEVSGSVEIPDPVEAPGSLDRPAPRNDPDTSDRPEPRDRPQGRSPADAPPLAVRAESGGEQRETTLDYAAETEPDTEDTYIDAEDNWPTHYVDLPLARLERWHERHGPEGARTDIADVRAAVRAERNELGRVRGERDHYHSEVQDLRREIARLDQSWIDADPENARRGSRRPPRYLLLFLLVLVAFVVGLETGARTGVGLF
ncbi:hypothetical protein DSY14_17490, partial [Nocardiopsis sp. MG754419]|nr:hypothetical protein [Nocardiopsis sp. MG754419]